MYLIEVKGPCQSWTPMSRYTDKVMGLEAMDALFCELKPGWQVRLIREDAR